MIEEKVPDENNRNEAKEILAKLRLVREWSDIRKASDQREHRAFIVEFAGMPKAGKTSVIETIRHYFSHGPKIRVADLPTDKWALRKKGYKVYTPAEGVSLRTPSHLKDDTLLDFNIWAGAHAIQQLLEARHDNYHDIVILDRGPWDAGCWLEYVKNYRLKNTENVEGVEKIVEFFQLSHWMTQSDLHVVLIVETGEAKRREVEQRLIEHGGAASDSELMNSMREIYKNRFNELQQLKAKQCAHVGDKSAIIINTSPVALTPKRIALDIIKAMFIILERKIKAKDEKETFTVPMMREYLDSYRKRIYPKTDVKRVDTFLSDIFVKRANKLSLRNRCRLGAKIRASDYPTEAIESFNRIKADNLISNLKKLLIDSEKEQ